MSKHGVEYQDFPVGDFVLTVIDGETVRLELPDPEEERINLWIENRSFARRMKKFFEREWKERK